MPIGPGIFVWAGRILDEGVYTLSLSSSRRDGCLGPVRLAWLGSCSLQLPAVSLPPCGPSAVWCGGRDSLRTCSPLCAVAGWLIGVSWVLDWVAWVAPEPCEG